MGDYDVVKAVLARIADMTWMQVAIKPAKPFAFGLLGFMIASLFNRHFRRDLTIRRAEIAPRAIAHDIVEHLKLRFHNPAEPGAFNILQKLSYVGVIFVLIPLMIFTGLTMSPGMDASWPWPSMLRARSPPRYIR